MNYLINRRIARAFLHVLGNEIWSNLSRERKLALLEIVDFFALNSLSVQTGLKSNLTEEKIIEFVDAKMAAIRKEELNAVLTLSPSSRSFSDYGVGINLADDMIQLRARRKKMDELLVKLKELSFQEAFMEKKREMILFAVENKLPLPTDEFDMYIISLVVPDILDKAAQEAIEVKIAEKSKQSAQK